MALTVPFREVSQPCRSGVEPGVTVRDGCSSRSPTALPHPLRVGRFRSVTVAAWSEVGIRPSQVCAPEVVRRRCRPDGGSPFAEHRPNLVAADHDLGLENFGKATAPRAPARGSRRDGSQNSAVLEHPFPMAMLCALAREPTVQPQELFDLSECRRGTRCRHEALAGRLSTLAASAASASISAYRS